MQMDLGSAAEGGIAPGGGWHRSGRRVASLWVECGIAPGGGHRVCPQGAGQRLLFWLGWHERLDKTPRIRRGGQYPTLLCASVSPLENDIKKQKNI